MRSQPEGLLVIETPRTSPSRFPRARFQRVLEVVVSLIFLALALRKISFRDLWAALTTANWLWLIPCVLITVGLLILKGWRWQLLFLPEHRLPYKPVFVALCAGYLASNVFPARAGELVRLVLLVSDQPVDAGTHAVLHCG